MQVKYCIASSKSVKVDSMACDMEFFETGMIVSIWDNFFTVEIVI